MSPSPDQSTDPENSDFPVSDIVTQGNYAAVAEFVPLTELSVHEREIQSLLNDACEHNFYYSPQFMKHAYLDEWNNKNVGIIFVRSTINQGSNLIGMFPVHRKKHGFLGLLSPIFALHNSHAASTSPLLRKSMEREAVSGYLNWVQENCGWQSVMCFDELLLNNSAWKYLKSQLRARRQPWVTIDSYERPAVDANSVPDASSYETRMKKKTCQDLRRKMRRLAEIGNLEFTVHEGDDRPAIVDEFLELEMNGWKGKSGSALACDERSLRFAKDFLATTKSPGLRIEVLRLDGRAIAMTMHIVSKGCAYHYKPTYDEDYARYSPGLLLHHWSMCQMFENKWADTLDSATIASSQVGSIWKDRVRVGRIMFACKQKRFHPLLHFTSAVNRAYIELKPALKKLKINFAQ